MEDFDILGSILQTADSGRLDLLPDRLKITHGFRARQVYSEEGHEEEIQVVRVDTFGRCPGCPFLLAKYLKTFQKQRRFVGRLRQSWQIVWNELSAAIIRCAAYHQIVQLKPAVAKPQNSDETKFFIQIPVMCVIHILEMYVDGVMTKRRKRHSHFTGENQLKYQPLKYVLNMEYYKFYNA
ncbi:hypothetical protein NQ317_009058 [Molorchus minor]|uniref:Transposase n=1 Tax=Molorchus minor TaxID=1323400 RepID=A0ABQ9J1F9_9CUCU|nr:hypothetical protein NQ317_009058 [Molorchus minor]